MLGASVGIILSGSAGAFFGSAGGEIFSKAWEESRETRSKMGYGQLIAAGALVAVLAAIVLGASALVLRFFGWSRHDILMLAGSALGDMAGVSLAFALPYLFGIGVRKVVERIRGPAPKLIGEIVKSWNGKATLEERAKYKQEMAQHLATLDPKIAQQVRDGLKERQLEIDKESETSGEYQLWLKGHPEAMAQMLVLMQSQLKSE